MRTFTHWYLLPKRTVERTLKRPFKTALLLFIGTGFASTAKSQSESVENSVSGIQTGIYGIWVHQERKLNNKVALRTEAGFDFEAWSGVVYGGTGFLLAPSVALEPRRYYNFRSRVRHRYRTDGNSGNFVSLRVTLRPDLFVISNTRTANTFGMFSVIPTIGARRNLGRRFNYETAFGIGYVFAFDRNRQNTESGHFLGLNLHFRFGYKINRGPS